MMVDFKKFKEIYKLEFQQFFGDENGWLSEDECGPFELDHGTIIIDRVYQQEEINVLDDYVNNIYMRQEDKKYKRVKRFNKSGHDYNLSIRFDNKSQIDVILSRLTNVNVLVYINNNFDIETVEKFKKYPNVSFFEGNLGLSDTNAVISVHDYLEKKKLYKLIIDDLKTKDFSELEQFICLYNIVKNFKSVKEFKGSKGLLDAQDSRNTTLILNNNYIVCSGYAHLLTELVRELNNPNLKLATIAVDFNGPHCITKTYIKDEKYDINGKYFSDPTFDRRIRIDKETNKEWIARDIYNHMLMSRSELESYKTGKYELEVRTSYYSSDVEECEPVSGIKIMQAVSNVNDTIFENMDDDMRRRIIEETIKINGKMNSYLFDKNPDKFNIDINDLGINIAKQKK